MYFYLAFSILTLISSAATFAFTDAIELLVCTNDGRFEVSLRMSFLLMPLGGKGRAVAGEGLTVTGIEKGPSDISAIGSVFTMGGLGSKREGWPSIAWSE